MFFVYFKEINVVICYYLEKEMERLALENELQEEKRKAK